MLIYKTIILVYEKLILAIRKNLCFKKRKILIYTDSRGYNFDNKLYKSSLQNTYIWELSKKYCTTIKVCEKKHTTLLDFIEYLSKDPFRKNYDKTILHVGVVDFSPRKLTQRNEIIKTKSNLIKKHFKTEINDFQNAIPLNTSYEGEITATIINETSIKYLNKKLMEFHNIIWINSNPIINEWQGSYWKKRPKNMEEVLKLQEHLKFNKIVNLSNLNNSLIKKYTSDNIHFNSEGMRWLARKIINEIES